MSTAKPAGKAVPAVPKPSAKSTRQSTAALGALLQQRITTGKAKGK